MTKYPKMHFLHHISANSITCRYDARMFVGSMDSLGVTLTVCWNLGLLRFSLPKIGGGVDKFSVPTCKNFQFWPFLSFGKISSFWVLISFLLVWWLMLLFTSGAVFFLADRFQYLYNLYKYTYEKWKFVVWKPFLEYFLLSA